MRFGFKEVCVLIKRRQEGHLFGETEQGALSKGYKLITWNFHSQILGKKVKTL